MKQLRLLYLQLGAWEVVAVGTLITERPPDRSRRALLTHGSSVGRQAVKRLPSAAQPIMVTRQTLQKTGALLLTDNAFFNFHREQLVTLARFNAVPAMYTFREFAVAGDLITYTSSIADAMRRAGNYVARIVNGEKPGDLPVQLPTQFELAINLKTAKAARPYHSTELARPRRRGDRMRRREFIAGLGAAAWPLAARAQPAERMRRVGVLMSINDPDAQVDVAALRQGLKEQGWIVGRTIDIAVRWRGANVELIGSFYPKIAQDARPARAQPVLKTGPRDCRRSRPLRNGSGPGTSRSTARRFFDQHPMWLGWQSSTALCRVGRWRRWPGR